MKVVKQIAHRRMASNGYTEVYAPDHPNAHKSTGYIYEHRYVMSRLLGRPLHLGEIVHHANGDKTDNSPENLVLEGSIAEHKVEHRKRADLQMPGEPNPVIECACGCGQHLLKYDEIGRPRSYVTRHSWRKGKHRFDPSEVAVCPCGCGESFLKHDRYGRVRTYIMGHYARVVSMATKQSCHVTSKE